jgi:RNA polymerase sigma-70 factor (ECF subfamily)
MTMASVSQHETSFAVAEEVALRSRARLVAMLAARFRDIEAAEDAVSEAFASALAAWPREGVPANPEAWLLTAARRRLIDYFRRGHESAASDELEELAGSIALSSEDELPDRRLALLFACAHPSIDATVRAPLMLQVVLGLEAAAIASAFLTSPAAMAQRLVRAKTKIRDSGIPFRVPERSELPERIEAVLDAVYACFSEGWGDPAGSDAGRSEFAGEAIFLGRLLMELLPDAPEAPGLLALMLFSESRRRARRDPAGRFVPLTRQDRSLWDESMIEEAEMLLRRAIAAGEIGRYQLEAAIQSAHVAGAKAGVVPWSEIVRLYDGLVQLTESPVARINRAYAVAEAEGAGAGLAALDAVAADRRMENYQPYWAVRAHLLARTNQRDEAIEAYRLAMGLESDPAVREYLAERIEELGSQI